MLEGQDVCYGIDVPLSSIGYAARRKPPAALVDAYSGTRKISSYPLIIKDYTDENE
jgi:hypothetical protein